MKRRIAHYSAPTVVKTVAPVAHYAAPEHYTSYVAPTYVKSAEVAQYDTPAHYTSYSAPSYNYHH
ncbi:hypothetical protein FF38_14536 [Lucilia cuprina]|uniref:Cuticle protein n=1 Tax=Lucilia cuprina TaxID=7375 RepID=A0A0L0CCJ9_LUCCU|nr:hypothetical protein FF38_14536 [Lucilia cuprina]